MQLVHLAQRVAECRYVKDAVFVRGLLFRRGGARRRVAERAWTSFFPRPLAAVPQIREDRIARLQRLEAEAVRRAVDPAAVPAFQEGVDTAARFPRRTRQPAGEEHVVLRLEPLEVRGERLDVALEVGRLRHRGAGQRMRNQTSGSQSSRAYGTGRSSIRTSVVSNRPTISNRSRRRFAS